MASFTLDLTRFAKKARGNMDLVLRKVALDLLSSVVVGRPVGRGTPVDTGQARGGWLVGIGTIPVGENGPDRGGNAAIQAGGAVIAQATIGALVYIANNVEHIRVLEYGRADGGPGSPQAPEGMLRVALRAYPGIVETSAREVNR